MSRWLIARTPIGRPYPCRCAERRFGQCSPMWCPCAGRTDHIAPGCCARVNSPDVVARERREYDARRRLAS